MDTGKDMVVVVDHRMEVDPRMGVDHLRKDIPQKEDLHLHSPRFEDSHREDQGLEGCLVAGYLVSGDCEPNGVHDRPVNDVNSEKSAIYVSFWENVYGKRDDSGGVVERTVVDDEEMMKVILYSIKILQEWVTKVL